MKLTNPAVNVKSGSSSASSAQDKQASKLPLFKFNVSSEEKHSSNGQRWALKPTMARRKNISRKTTKTARKKSPSKRSFIRRKVKPKSIPKSDGDSIKSSSSIPSSDNPVNVLPKLSPTTESFLQRNRLNVINHAPTFLSAEDEWSSSRLTSSERVKREDELRRVNSNLEYFIPAFLQNFNM